MNSSAPTYDLTQLVRWLPIAIAATLLGLLFWADPLVLLIGVAALLLAGSTVSERNSLAVLILMLPFHRAGLGLDIGSGFGVFDFYAIWFLLLYFWRGLIVGAFRIERHPVILLGFVMLISFVPSMINATEMKWVWRGLAQILLGVLVMGAVYDVLARRNSEKFIIGLLRGLIAVSALFTVQGIVLSLQYQTMMGMAGGRTYNILFGDPNYYACYLLVVMSFSLAFATVERNRRWKRVMAFFSLLFFSGIILTVSRAGYLALMIIGAGFVLYVWKYTGIKRLLLSVLLISVGSVVIVLFATNLGQNLMTLVSVSDRVSGAVGGKDPSVNQRTDIQKVGWRMAQHTPLFGIGFGNFEIVFGRFRENTLHTHPSEACHNTYLKLLAETGIVGFLCAMLFYGALMRTLWTSFRRSRDDARRMLLFGCMMALMSYFLMSATLDQVYEMHFWSLAGLTLAYAAIAREQESANSSRESSHSSEVR
ncbi:MAG: O-antigen ligase family protein [Ignavibacteriae bacterium]|nr:O-antigen ligase family protein [Ignavibacteriota bacterium]